MIICRSFVHLVDTRHPLVTLWFFKEMEGVVRNLGLQNNLLRFSVELNDQEESFSWSDGDLIKALRASEQKIEAVKAAWVLCRFLDQFNESNEILCNFVAKEVGIVLESVPFLLIGDELTSSCKDSSCKRKKRSGRKKSGNVQLKVDRDRLFVRLPLNRNGIRRLLFDRLQKLASGG